MIFAFGGGLVIGCIVILIFVIRGLHTGFWLKNEIVKAAAILIAVILGVIAAAFAIQFEHVKTKGCGDSER